MTPPRGHIKVARKSFSPAYGDPWWLEPREFSKWEAWIDLLQLAQWRKFRHVTNAGIVQLERGEFVASLRWLADRWQWSAARVRRYLEDAVKAERLAKQQEKQAGTVYRVVNYETYQGTVSESETASETADDTDVKQPRNKNKKVKQLKQTATTGADAPDPEDPVVRFPVATCNVVFDRWVQRRGSVNYGLLRKALLPFFPAVGATFTQEQLLSAVDAFAELAESDRPEFSQKWNVQKFASELPRWVRLGALPYVDDWGIPTERASLLKLFPSEFQPSGRYVA